MFWKTLARGSREERRIFLKQHPFPTFIFLEEHFMEFHWAMNEWSLEYFTFSCRF